MKKLSFILFIIVLVSACGSGTSSNADNGPQQTVLSNTTVSTDTNITASSTITTTRVQKQNKFGSAKFGSAKFSN